MNKKATFVTAVLLVLGVAVFFAGDASLTNACTGRSGAAAKTAGAGKASCSKGAALAGARSCSRSASAATLAEINYREGKRLVLTGNSACGAELELTESCQSVFKTADGKIYRLMKNGHAKKMQNTKADNGFEIVTYVRLLDGEKYLEVKNFKTL